MLGRELLDPRSLEGGDIAGLGLLDVTTTLAADKITRQRSIAWHGGTNPSRIARGLRLPAEKLDRIEGALRERFGQVRRVQLAGLDVFTAARPA